MKLRCLWITAWFQAYQEPNCLPYVLQFIPRCPCILHYSDKLALSCWLQLLSCWNYPIKKGKIFTSSVVLEHHCSSSCKPAFKNSPLLNEQHSRRSSKLLKSCTFKYAYTWLNVFLIIIGGTWLFFIVSSVFSRHLTMLCQCTLDACLDSALECILFSEPRDGLTRLALGAYEGQ